MAEIFNFPSTRAVFEGGRLDGREFMVRSAPPKGFCVPYWIGHMYLSVRYVRAGRVDQAGREVYAIEDPDRALSAPPTADS